MAAVNAALFGKIFHESGEIEFRCGNNCNGSGTRRSPEFAWRVRRHAELLLKRPLFTRRLNYEKLIGTIPARL
ncbi:hypothetical protein BURPS305_1892 [Burkholderia pseudomallei 305]|nr:hypothetical protein BURPS305_1892 [Burkholderia pseudomallei 305]